VRWWLACVLGPMLIAVAGCAATDANAQAPQPAGRLPSPLAKKVCASEAQGEVADSLGEHSRSVTTPVWSHHRYSCTYEYRQGTITLSVKELSSWRQTYAYFDRFKKQFGDRHSIVGLGQAAYVTDNGWVAVRKDWKVLFVSSQLKGRINGSAASGTAAEAVAVVILACWSGD
jgi:hypothetical protein